MVNLGLINGEELTKKRDLMRSIEIKKHKNLNKEEGKFISKQMIRKGLIMFYFLNRPTTLIKQLIIKIK
jgi:hypothetical protein